MRPRRSIAVCPRSRGSRSPRHSGGSDGPGESGPRPSRGVVGEFVADDAGTTSEPARFAVVRLTDAILTDAATLAEVRALRAYDTVQLPSARAAAQADDRVRAFAAFDDRLRDAAASEGFVLVPRSV